MAYMTQNEFLELQNELKQRDANRQQQNFNNQKRVSYFGLKDDGEEAIVRFAYSDQSQIYNDIVTCHELTVNGKFRKANCLRSFRDPIDKCPMCASGQNFKQRIYIRLLEYKRAEDGSITVEPKVWDRPKAYVDILTNFFTEYGDISECVFKVKRSGARGSTDTTYSIMFGNPSIYNAQLYPKDFSAFENYKIIGGPVLDLSYDDLAKYANVGDAELNTNQTFTPKTELDSQSKVSYSDNYYNNMNGVQYSHPTQTTSYAPQDALADTQTPRRVIYQ